MHVNVSTDTDRWISPLQTQMEPAANLKTDASSPSRTGGQVDQVIVSQEGRQAAARGEGRFSEMEAAVQDGDMESLSQAAKKLAGNLEVNWDAVVDPDGTIYGSAYVESLVTQYQKASDTIKEYYSEAHQENLTFDNPYTHILQKYKITDSPYFLSDMPKSEREMAFEQERALLWDRNLTLNDPYALKSSGGVIKAEDADRIAKQAARDKLDKLIQERKERAESGDIA